MVSRRALIRSGAAGLLVTTLSRRAFAASPSPADPTAIVTAIYSRAAKGKGDSGGAFIIENKAAKAKYLSKSLVALWAKADAHTPKGDVGPIDFDPVTNSQEPDVKSFKVAPEKQEADKATLAVTIEGRNAPARKPADRTIRYEFVRDGIEWKIDDIKGASDGAPWSIRAMLAASLKN
ncbi:MAG: YbjP/YqhG family protein [Xanthobacteraceae bacterium]|nr:YbjP/YqhG family protein [Xanthobacteraceae bacterium]